MEDGAGVHSRTFSRENWRTPICLTVLHLLFQRLFDVEVYQGGGQKRPLVSPLVSRVDLSRRLFPLQRIALQSIEPTFPINMGMWAPLLIFLFGGSSNPITSLAIFLQAVMNCREKQAFLTLSVFCSRKFSVQISEDTESREIAI